MSRVDANDGGYLTGNTFSEYGCDGVRQVNAPSEAPKPADLPASMDLIFEHYDGTSARAAVKTVMTPFYVAAHTDKLDDPFYSVEMSGKA